MQIETLGGALDHGWRLHVRCAWGKRVAMKSVRECVYGGELDLPTLVWTRGRDCPLAAMEQRLKCPRCGSRRVRLISQPPSSSWSVRAGSGHI